MDVSFYQNVEQGYIYQIFTFNRFYYSNLINDKYYQVQYLSIGNEFTLEFSNMQYVILENITIEGTEFQKSLNGGALALQDCTYDFFYSNSILIQESIFMKNTALGYGGAILLENSDAQIENCIIQYNKAQIGGGIRYMGLSGGSLNLTIQILDEENNPFIFDMDLFNNQNGGYTKFIQEEVANFKIKANPANEKIKIFGQYFTDYTKYNQQDFTFSIKDMMIISDPNSFNYIQFETTAIQRTIKNKDRNITQGPFHVKLNIQFRECIEGEVYKLSGSILYCQECSEGTYYLQKPDKELYQTQICKRCPQYSQTCFRNNIQLKEGYWRINNQTDSIIYCKNRPTNCIPDENSKYCIQGNYGPLCESCDIYGNFWDQQYQSDGKYGCLNCNKLQKVEYIMPTILIVIGMAIYILFSIRVSLLVSRQIIQGYYLRRLGIISISKSAFADNTNMNMKAMLHYMQIAALINTFEVELPIFMTFFPQQIGTPVQNILFSFDCYLNKAQESKFPIVFVRTLWSLCVPLFYVIGSYSMSGLVFLIFFMQPNMIQNLLSVMSCREIDKKNYILSDISYSCYTDIHINYIIFICLPGLFLWLIALPAYFLRNLVLNKEKLDYATIRLQYGFLYQDYKQNSYYWEYIKSYKKLLVVIILNFYGEPYTNKLIIILIVFLLYYVALSKFQPYQMIYFQILDKNSIVVIIILIIMNIFLYNKPDIIQQQFFYILLLIIHNGYQLFLIKEVVLAKLNTQYLNQFNYFKRKIIQCFPKAQKYIKIVDKVSTKTFKNWKK
ncbi:hypothetical protein IMG5_161980, partial [Ichthyophthirius multifiliis]